MTLLVALVMVLGLLVRIVPERYRTRLRVIMS